MDADADIEYEYYVDIEFTSQAEPNQRYSHVLEVENKIKASVSAINTNSVGIIRAGQCLMAVSAPDALYRMMAKLRNLIGEDPRLIATAGRVRRLGSIQGAQPAILGE